MEININDTKELVAWCGAIVGASIGLYDISIYNFAAFIFPVALFSILLLLSRINKYIKCSKINKNA